ncbi:MAG: disulfide bond formation protein B [Gammaproteobacteria bacterium]
MNRWLALVNRFSYWAGLAGFCLVLLATALVYQYILDYDPCVICIHVRIWVMALLLVAIVGMLLHRSRLAVLVMHFLSLLVSGVLLERAWKLLGIERGTVIGDCNFDLGMPAFLPLDSWFPWLFEVKESCGYTPPLPIGLSMAEMMVILSVALVVITLVMTVFSALVIGRGTHSAR